MAKVRVPVAGTVGKSVLIESGGTVGATVGADLKLSDGSVPTLAKLALALSLETTTEKWPFTLWNRLLEIPANVVAIGGSDPIIVTGQWTFHDEIRIRTDIVTATPPTTEAVTGGVTIYDLDSTDQLAVIGFQGNNELRIKNVMHGGDIVLQIEDTAGTLLTGVAVTSPSVGVRQLLLPLQNNAASPSLALGDGDSGFYEIADDNVGVSIGGTLQSTWVGVAYNSAVSGGFSMRNEVASAVNPVYTIKGDNDTGLGSAGPNMFSAITGGREAVRYSGASGHVLVNSEIHANITAGTTQTQAGGFQLLSSHSEVAVVANTNDTVVAPIAATGRVLSIVNNGANTLQIFPAPGDDLGTGVDIAITLASGGKLLFMSYDITTWVQFV